MPLLSAVVERRGEPLAPLDLELAIEGLGRPGGDELAQIVERAMAERANAVEKVREGNEKAIGAIMGPAMRETNGRADGAEVQRLIRRAAVGRVARPGSAEPRRPPVGAVVSPLLR